MPTHNDPGYLKADGVDYPLAEYFNTLFRSVIRAEFTNTQTISGTKSLTDADFQFQVLTASGANRNVRLAPEGADNHITVIENGGGSNNLVVQDDSGGSTFVTLLPGEWCIAISNGVAWKILFATDAPADGTPYARQDHGWVAAATGGGGKYPAFARCSVSSGVPNPTSDLLAQTAIYVMPHDGDTYPQWDGSDFAQQAFAQQTLSLNAAHTSASLYDIYLWLDGSTQRVVTGPAWSSSSSRGTGAGTAETEDLQGVTVNKVSMTVRNGASTYTMAARAGTLVGTFVASANGQVEWSAKYRGLWNKYNQMRAGFFLCPGYADDNAATSYLTTSTSWTEANGGTGSRINFVLGEATLIELVLTALTTIGASSSSLYGIGLDSITQADVSGTSNNSVAATGAISCNHKGVPLAVGSHYASFLIARGGSNNATFYADAGRRGGEAADSPETYITGSLMM